MIHPDRPASCVAIDQTEAKATPQQLRALGCFNRMHEGRSKRDRSLFDLAATEGEIALTIFLEEESRTHRDPSWAANNLQAMYHYALGDFATAIEFETLALEAAQFPKLAWMSAINLESFHRETGEINQAIEYARMALEFDDGHPLGHLALAQCLAHLHQVDEADKIIAALVDAVDFNNPRDLMAAVMEHEESLHRLVLPSVQRLMKKIATLKENA